MWTYDLSSGWLYEQGRRYVQGTGMLPAGLYTISQAFDDMHGGPMTMRLTPAPGNPDKETRYLIFQGGAARGIILPPVARAYINASPDRHLTVVASVDADNPPLREHIVV